LLERNKDEEKPGIKKRIDELEKEYSGLNAEQKFNKAILSAKNVLEMMLRDIIKKVPELSIRSANGRYLVHFHACRSYFKTQVTDAHESDYAEAMMGHSSIKLTYYRQNAKARAETYLKVEPHLVISDFSQVQKNIESLEQRLKEAEIQLAMAKQYQETRQNFKQ
jgi:integrase